MSKVFTVDDIQEVTLIRNMLGVEAVWCTILFKGCSNPVKFYASPTEGDSFQREMYERLMSGQFGEVIDGAGAHYITIPPNQTQLESAALEKRKQLLIETDYTEFPSTRSRMSAEEISKWETYRQALRDITKQQGFPWDPQWPTKP
jgi:hypothetical protein